MLSRLHNNKRRTIKPATASFRKKDKNRGVWRTGLVKFWLFAAVAVLFVRLVQVQIVHHEVYAQRAAEQYTRRYTKEAARGPILDRNGTPLAVNVPRFEIGVDKVTAGNLKNLCDKLAPLLGHKPQAMRERLRSSGNYVQISRKLSEEKASVIQALQLRGVSIIEKSERLYPFKGKMAQVAGFVGIDGQGLSGIELELEDELAGKDGWGLHQRTARGKNAGPIINRQKAPRLGSTVILTIDGVIQTIAEEELLKTVRRHNAKGGTAIVMDPASGELLAMASVPGFDPNIASQSAAEAWRIRAVTDIFEPGSTFKIVVMLAALRDSIIRMDEKVFCEQGRYRIFGKVIKDAEKHGRLTFEEVFQHSSNIGVAKIAMKIGKKKFYVAARDLGFGNKTGIRLPGEVKGILRNPSEWSRLSLPFIAFGHEVAVTALQMAMAYGAVANGGMLMKPAIIKEIRDYKNDVVDKFKPHVIRQVMPPDIAQQMMKMLVKVVEDGTGTQARMENVTVAGKTGTAQKPLAGGAGYSQTAYIASFVGFCPAEGARLLVHVAIDEPWPVHSGGSVAAPAVKEMLDRIMKVRKQPEPVGRRTTTTRHTSVDRAIPNVTGKHIDDAKRLLDQIGVEYEITGEGDLVQKQSLVAGGDRRVNLQVGTVKNATDYTNMPDLVGLSLRNAVAKASVLGLHVKVVGSGKVISQKPAEGDKIKVGARCYLECRPPFAISSLMN